MDGSWTGSASLLSGDRYSVIMIVTVSVIIIKNINLVTINCKILPLVQGM